MDAATRWLRGRSHAEIFDRGASGDGSQRPLGTVIRTERDAPLGSAIERILQGQERYRDSRIPARGEFQRDRPDQYR